MNLIKIKIGIKKIIKSKLFFTFYKIFNSLLFKLKQIFCKHDWIVLNNKIYEPDELLCLKCNKSSII
jgi:hypothetical protein